MSTAGQRRPESRSGPGPGVGGRAAAPRRKGTPDTPETAADANSPAAGRPGPAADLDSTSAPPIR